MALLCTHEEMYTMHGNKVCTYDIIPKGIRCVYISGKSELKVKIAR